MINEFIMISFTNFRYEIRVWVVLEKEIFFFLKNNIYLFLLLLLFLSLFGKFWSVIIVMVLTCFLVFLFGRY